MRRKAKTSHVIQIGKWYLRDFSSADEPALVKYADNYNVWINLRDGFPHPYTAEDARKWIRLTKNCENQKIFAIAGDEEVIGSIGVHRFSDVYHRTAEIGYWLAEPYWGRGIVTLAVQAVTKYAFDKFDLARIQAEVFEWNQASMRVLEKCGYQREARIRKNITKAGKTIDSYLYAIFKE